jgi:hypothetical protein
VGTAAGGSTIHTGGRSRMLYAIRDEIEEYVVELFDELLSEPRSAE